MEETSTKPLTIKFDVIDDSIIPSMRIYLVQNLNSQSIGCKLKRQKELFL
jgi:hypothetical protein